jgi:hypothetical protein
MLPALIILLFQGDAQLPARRAFAQPSDEERAGHAAMLAQLEEVRKKTKRNNAYLGDQQLEKLAESRAALDPVTASPKTLAKLDYDFGMNYLRLGRVDEAVASLEACYQRLAGAFPRAEWPPFAERLAYDLAVANMRKGENDNCVARHTAQSCLLPIEGEGRHVDETGSRAAMKWLRESIATSPDETVKLCSRWLLNIAAMTVGEYPAGLSESERIDPAVFASEAEFPRFPDIAPALGLNDMNLSGGAILEDLDGDGLIDVFTSSWDTAVALKYHRNRGDGTFENVSERANLAGLYGGLNLLSGDYDSDGWTDVLVLRGAWLFGARGQIPKSLLQNRGGQSFLDVTIRAGMNEQYYPSQAAGYSDYDLDGDLDLYMGSEANGESPFPGQLFQNQGDGTFRDVARAARVENVRFAKGVAWGDYDADRWPDLYVTNLNGKNRLYKNLGDGHFEDVAEKLDVTRPTNSFPCWFWDFDNDGALDLFASCYELVDPQASLRLGPVAGSYLGIEPAELAALYKGDGKGGFTDVARKSNLKRLTLPMGANFGDLDNDGWLDFYLGTGYPAYDGLIPNVLYWNRGGEKFLDVSAAAGVGHLQKGHGVAMADLDEDGDLDLFEQMGGAYPGDGFGDTLYENPGTPNGWLKLDLVGVRSNRSAIGTRVHAEFVEDGKTRHLWRWVGSGGSFGCNSLRVHLGLGSAARVAKLEVYWPASDTTQVFTDLAAGATLEIVEGASAVRRVERAPFRLGGGVR